MFKLGEVYRNFVISNKERKVASLKNKEQNAFDQGTAFYDEIKRLKTIPKDDLLEKEKEFLETSDYREGEIEDEVRARYLELKSEKTKLELEKLNLPEKDLKKLRTRLKKIKELEAKKLSKRELRKLRKVKRETDLKIIKEQVKLVQNNLRSLNINHAEVTKRLGEELIAGDKRIEIEDEIGKILENIMQNIPVLEKKTFLLEEEIAEIKRTKITPKDKKEFIIEQLEHEYNKINLMKTMLERLVPEKLNIEGYGANPERQKLKVQIKHRTVDIEKIEERLQSMKKWKKEEEERLDENGMEFTARDLQLMEKSESKLQVELDELTNQRATLRQKLEKILDSDSTNTVRDDFAYKLANSFAQKYDANN